MPTAIHEERGQEKKAMTQASDGEETTIDENPGSGFDDDLFGRYRPRLTMTRQENGQRGECLVRNKSGTWTGMLMT